MAKAVKKELSYSELVTKRNELKKKYLDLRFQMVIGHVDNPVQKSYIESACFSSGSSRDIRHAAAAGCGYELWL